MIELLERFGYYPRSCVWELTLLCDLRCRHCGSYAGARRPDELGLAECRRVAEQLADSGCRRVTLSGGEPTLHPHWHEVGKHLTDRGVQANILSNGWSWSAEHIDKVRFARLSNVGFSLDGLESAHDRVRRQGSFARVVAALELCAARGLRTAVATHINQLNRAHLGELRALLGELGVHTWQVQLGVPWGAMADHRELIIEPEDLLWLIPRIAELRAAGGGPALSVADNLGYFGQHETGFRDWQAPIDFWVGCRAGCQIIGIESNGNVKGCLSLPSARHGDDTFVEGNLRHERLDAIWQRPFAFAYNRRFSERQLEGFCACCRYRDVCRGGCFWTAYSHRTARLDNPYCFYRQAVKHRRFDLLGDDRPTAEELAAAG